MDLFVRDLELGLHVEHIYIYISQETKRNDKVRSNGASP